MDKNSPPDSYINLFKMFNAIYPVSRELMNAFIKNCEVKNFKKKTKLLKPGNRSSSIYFIVKGSARVYYIDNKGNEINSWLLLENELVISVYSFFTGNTSFEYLETLEDCILIELQREKVDQLYEEFIEFNFIGRKLTEHYYIQTEVQANNLRTLSAKENYEQLVAKRPELIQRISLGHIASYLGISQETLSRIRK